jgi:hypothetical protein
MAIQQSQPWAFSRDRYEQGRRDVTYRRQSMYGRATIPAGAAPVAGPPRLSRSVRGEVVPTRCLGAWPAVPPVRWARRARRCRRPYTGRSEGASVRFRYHPGSAPARRSQAQSQTPGTRLLRSSRSGPAGRMPPQSIDARWRGSVRTGAFGCNGGVYGVLKVSQIVSVKSA